MKIKTTLLVLFALLHLQTNAQCITDQNNVYSFSYNGNLYKIVKENRDWTYAHGCAGSEGGFLAIINTQEEQDSIFYHANLARITSSNTVAPDGGNGAYLWIGGSDISVEGQWNWNPFSGPSIPFWQGTGATGSSVGGQYSNWGGNINGNEPDNFGSGQDALGFAITNWPLGTAGEWNDIQKSNSLYYIIEYSGDQLEIKDNEINNYLNCYPNPANDLITIELPSNTILTKNSVLSIYTIYGERISEIKISANLQTIDTKNIPNGIYILRTNHIGTVQKTIKITISK